MTAILQGIVKSEINASATTNWWHIFKHIGELFNAYLFRLLQLTSYVIVAKLRPNLFFESLMVFNSSITSKFESIAVHGFTLQKIIENNEIFVNLHKTLEILYSTYISMVDFQGFNWSYWLNCRYQLYTYRLYNWCVCVSLFTRMSTQYELRWRRNSAANWKCFFFAISSNFFGATRKTNEDRSPNTYWGFFKSKIIF